MMHAQAPGPGISLPGVIRGGYSDYAPIQVLNRGGFSEVFLATELASRSPVALKFIECGEAVTKYVEREIMNHMRLRHPHIIGLREVFLTEKHLVLAMEYAAGGDLFAYTAAKQQLSEEEARWFFKQLLVALDYCHRMGVTSRDIKLENMLLDDHPQPLMKLADFGFSKHAYMHSAPTSRVGTPAYLAPEVAGNPPGHSYDGSKADIWACGVSLFVMVTGAYPFRRTGDRDLKGQKQVLAMLHRILAADYLFPSEASLSPEVRDLIRRILVVDPGQRPSIEELLHHPWLCTDDVLPKALLFNQSMVEESMAHQPTAQKLAEVARIVAEARVLPTGAPISSSTAPDNSTAGGGQVESANSDRATHTTYASTLADKLFSESLTDIEQIHTRQC